MNDLQQRENEPTLSTALERVVETSQRVLIDRLELLRVEVEEDVSRTLQSMVFLVGAAVLGICGWLALLAAVIRWLDGLLPLSASLAIVGGANAIIAGVLAAYGVSSFRKIRLLGPDAPSNGRG